jgi:hypothetical protein
MYCQNNFSATLIFSIPATWHMPGSQWAQKNDKDLGNTHYHEGLLVRVVGYSVLPQTAALLFLRELSPLLCTLQSVSRGKHCLCLPIAISIAIAHAQRGVWEQHHHNPRMQEHLEQSRHLGLCSSEMLCGTGWQPVEHPRKVRTLALQLNHTAAWPTPSYCHATYMNTMPAQPISALQCIVLDVYTSYTEPMSPRHIIQSEPHVMR